MRKRHRKSDYVVVIMMVSGLSFFIHAETTANNVQTHAFSFVGIGMLVMSLLADGAVVNLNEKLMSVHNLGQDELIFVLYSLAASFMFFMTVITGELWRGIAFVLTDGPLQGDASPSLTSREKVLSTLAFITMGFLGSSCAGAITKHFGALSMSITSTARKVRHAIGWERQTMMLFGLCCLTPSCHQRSTLLRLRRFSFPSSFSRKSVPFNMSSVWPSFVSPW